MQQHQHSWNASSPPPHLTATHAQCAESGTHVQAHKEQMHRGTPIPATPGALHTNHTASNTLRQHTGALLGQVGFAPNWTSSGCFWHVQACAACRNAVTNADNSTTQPNVHTQQQPGECRARTSKAQSQVLQRHAVSTTSSCAKCCQRSKQTPTYSRHTGAQTKLSSE
jgi:hypothetical protein